MTLPAKPDIRPVNPNFSSGPCAKRPGWTPSVLTNAVLGRSHRSKEGKARIQLVTDKTRESSVPDTIGSVLFLPILAPLRWLCGPAGRTWRRYAGLGKLRQRLDH